MAQSATGRAVAAHGRLQDVVDNDPKVVPSLIALKKELKALASHRNAVAHIGATTFSPTDDDVKIFLAVVLADGVVQRRFLGRVLERVEVRALRLGERRSQPLEPQADGRRGEAGVRGLLTRPAVRPHWIHAPIG